MAEMQEEMYNQHSDWSKSEGRRSSGYGLHERQYQAGQEEKVLPRHLHIVIDLRILLGIISCLAVLFSFWAMYGAMESYISNPDLTRVLIWVPILFLVFFVVLANIIYNRKR
jgi:hypothetical protein